MDLVQQLEQELVALKHEYEKFIKGNKSAGTRARKVLQNIKRTCQDLRVSIQGVKKESDGILPGLVWQQILKGESSLQRLSYRARPHERRCRGLHQKQLEKRAGGQLTRCAICPAPKPLSMLTTDTPPAHELSIESSAEMPPKLAP